MKARSLDRRVRIERAVPVDDGYQTRTDAWAPLGEVWAQFIRTGGREGREAAGREALATASFRIRFSEELRDLLPSDRVIYPADGAGRVYDIQSVVEIGRREGLELICVAGSDG